MKRRFPFIKQLDSMQCGVACMLMICKYWGKEYTFKSLSDFCVPSKDGVSLKAIADLALLLGLDYTAGKVSIEELLHCPVPAILHWNQNHFVVLYKIKNDKTFYVADPAKGKVKYSLEEFKNHFLSIENVEIKKGIAIFMEPTSKFGTIDLKEDKKRDFSFLWRYVLQYKRYFLQIVLGLFLGCILQLIFPFLTQSIVDIGIKNSNLGFIWLILIGELTIVLARTCTDVIRNWLLLHISMRINISLVSDFFTKLLKLPMSYFDTKLMGDLFQRIGDHDRIQSFLTIQLLQLFFAAISFFVFGIVLFLYDPKIFYIFFLGSILYALWIVFFLEKRKRIDYDLFDKQASTQNKTYQFIDAIQEIKLQDCEVRRRIEWEDTQAALFRVQMQALKLRMQQSSGGVLINEIKNIIVTVITANCVISGTMTLGMMLAVQYIIGQLSSPLSQFIDFVYSLQDMRISLERINEVHNADNEDRGHVKKRFEVASDDISFTNVSFSYDVHAIIPTISNVSFTIPKSKVTAIVGASGSGKTTLIKLLLGYYPLSHGNIRIEGNKLSEINLQEWRRHCGVVMQDGYIFSESIMRNIAVGDKNVDVEKVYEAARIANLYEYVDSLPLKFDTIIGKDGVGISQGQKQRILIARAVYKEPDYIFLDEATNALDAKNERIIIENLNSFYKGRTVLVVAHRLSTVRHADQIIVIDDGKIVEIGNHNELTNLRGVYYELVKNQLELGL